MALKKKEPMKPKKSNRPKKMVLLKDIVIKAGTVFENCDNETRTFFEGNYSHILGLSNDTSGEIIYQANHEDMKDIFVELIE